MVRERFGDTKTEPCDQAEPAAAVPGADLAPERAAIPASTLEQANRQLEKSGTLPAVKVEPAEPEVAQPPRPLFDRIDADGNGFLSEKELAAAVQDKSFTGLEAQQVAIFYKCRDKLQELSNDEWGRENSGISRADLAKASELGLAVVEAITGAQAVKEWASVAENFKRADSDGDGFLSPLEVRQAMARDDLSSQDQQALAYMQQKGETIAEASNDEWGRETSGITLKDIEAHYRDVSTSSDAKWVLPLVVTAMRTKESQGSDISHDLFASTDPLESIKPDAIRQGFIGDCYFLAALAAVARAHPETIQQMIKDNEDGTYTVKFPGTPSEKITVTAPTEAELGLYSHGSKYGIWAPVIEKAYGKYCQQHFWRRGPANISGGNTPQEGADGGGSVVRAMELLTGNDTDRDDLALTLDSTTKQKLTEALQSRPAKAVTCASQNATPASIAALLTPLNDPFGDFVGETKNGFAANHAYTVIGFDPNGPDGGTVTVRNPWGEGEGTTRGTIQISFKQFNDNFSTVTYEQ